MATEEWEATEEGDAAEGERRFQAWLAEPAVQQAFTELAQARQVSRRAQGDDYFQEGDPQAAIEAYRHDTGLEITTHALAATVEQAYCHMGDVFKLTGEGELAIAAYARALAVWRLYGYGEMPVASLAVAYLEQGQVDEALRLCEAYSGEALDFCVREVREEARRLKAGERPSPNPASGCRRIHSPFRAAEEPLPPRTFPAWPLPWTDLAPDLPVNPPLPPP